MLLFSLEGFSPAALSCYGASWNRSESIDSLASTGTTWDRVITPVTDPLLQLNRWLTAGIFSGGDMTVVTDDDRIGDLPSADGIGELIVLPSRDEGVAESIEETAIASLVAIAAEQLAENPHVWLHSRFLTRCWDAPRDLFPLDPFDEEEMMPMDASESIEFEFSGGGAISGAGEDFADAGDDVRPDVPLILDRWRAPRERIRSGDDPDWIMAWMRTYGCQIRLVDTMLGLLSELAFEAGHTSTIVTGTSGFSLGQNGAIGHRTGPLRSCHLHVPLIIGGGGGRGGLGMGGIRDRRVRSADGLPDIVAALIDRPDSAPVSPESWAAVAQENVSDENENDDNAVTTSCHGRPQSITTDDWFYVRHGAIADDPDSTSPDEDNADAGDSKPTDSEPSFIDSDGHLFLKPDDLNDTNNVARLRPETADQFHLRLG